MVNIDQIERTNNSRFYEMFLQGRDIREISNMINKYNPNLGEEVDTGLLGHALAEYTDEISKKEMFEEQIDALRKKDSKNLINRLESVEYLKNTIYQAFTKPHINPKEIYKFLPPSRENLMKEITQNINKGKKLSPQEENFLKILTYSARRTATPLKRVNYGIRSTGELPIEFLEALTNWEKVYLVRGRWTKKNPNFKKDFKKFIIEHMVLGLDQFHKNYSDLVSRKKISRIPNFPYEQQIRNQFENLQNKQIPKKVQAHFL
ncbi:MAG: hypothetical protein U9Q99_03220 [Nanoarchaeota archaeon]|nr:hypothetical protein [Nanoarchaeota archaeon]